MHFVDVTAESREASRPNAGSIVEELPSHEVVMCVLRLRTLRAQIADRHPGH